SFYRWDMALRKVFKLVGGSQVDVRVDAFNAFNRVNFNAPSGNSLVAGNSAFGTITGAKTPREFQFSLNFRF
ncbi:MAG TPA: hypothetical protein VF921_21520, partial [Vicinamibacterales bacterium]